MPKLLVVMVVSLFAVGCSHGPRLEVFPADVVQLRSPVEPGKGCIDRVLFKSRLTGYIEQTVDREGGFFRVLVRHRYFRDAVDKKGRLRAPLARGKAEPAEVVFYNVQCIDDETVLITPMSDRGPVVSPSVLDELQRGELAAYAQRLGNVIVDTPPPPAPAAALPADDPSGRNCIASQLPEWQGATAAQKKTLLDRCRGAAPTP